MTGVDMRSLLAKCNAFSKQALNSAAGQAVNRTHYEVTIEHYLLACCADAHSDIPLVLGQAGVDLDKVVRLLNAALDDFRTGNAGRPVFSPLLLELLESAWLVASVDLGLAEIRSGAVLLAFLRKPAVYAQGNYADALAVINRDAVLRDFGGLAKVSDETAATPAASAPGLPAQAGDSFLARFCEDFTAKAREGRIDPVFGRDAEIRQMVDILARRRKNNPILVGEPGVGKTAVLEGLALRIVEGDVPDVLAGTTLLSLDMGLLEAGAGMKGEFERRLKGVLDEIRGSEVPIILFIDEAHMLVGAGGQAGGSDAANLMKPALARGEIRTCAATTWKEYKKYFEKDPALARRFQLVRLEEPDVETATLILRGVRETYEKAHGVRIRDDAIVASADLAHRYITGRFLPDKAIDLLDTACARVKVSLSAKPGVLEDGERAVQAMERELAAMERDAKNGVSVDAGQVEGLKAALAQKRDEVALVHGQWEEERLAARAYVEARTAMEEGLDSAPFASAKARLLEVQKEHALVHVDVTRDVVAEIVSDWTGIPQGRMAEEQADVTRNLEKLLLERIKGQDDAIARLARGIQEAAAGLKAGDQPLGVFLLVGPSGVGKTATGLALAELLFGDSSSVVTINMSEFQEKHSVSRLVGSPPGYVGYGEGGMLTEAVRRRPYSVVLLDEAEKAHIDVMNLFYQVFDKGTLKDGEGTEVSFRNTIILLTSNLATDIIQEMTQADADVDMDQVLEVARPVLSEHFRPALLARMTVVPYRSLPSDAMAGITNLKLAALAGRLKENRGMTLTWTPEVTSQIVARCVETETGARNIDAILQGSVLPRLAESLLDHMAQGSMPAGVQLGTGEDGHFTMTFGQEQENGR